MPEEKDEITISKPLADKMGWKVGDEVVFKDEYFDKEYSLVIYDIYDYQGSLTVFVEMDWLNDLLGYEKGAYNAYLSDEKMDVPDEYLAKCIT